MTSNFMNSDQIIRGAQAFITGSLVEVTMNGSMGVYTLVAWANGWLLLRPLPDEKHKDFLVSEREVQQIASANYRYLSTVGILEKT